MDRLNNLKNSNKTLLENALTSQNPITLTDGFVIDADYFIKFLHSMYLMREVTKSLEEDHKGCHIYNIEGEDFDVIEFFGDSSNPDFSVERLENGLPVTDSISVDLDFLQSKSNKNRFLVIGRCYPIEIGDSITNPLNHDTTAQVWGFYQLDGSNMVKSNEEAVVIQQNKARIVYGWFCSVISCSNFINNIDPVKQLSQDHPCHKICSLQYGDIDTMLDRQIPEPYNGNPITSKLIFISSNPSIGEIEDNPRVTWNYNDIRDFFNERFYPQSPDSISPYVYHPENSYKYYPRSLAGKGDIKSSDMTRGYSKRPVPFWRNAAKIAELLLGKGATLQDCLLTELVHCKSKSEIGVPQAMNTCLERFLGGFLDMITAVHKVDSGRQIVAIVTGKKTFDAMNSYADKNNYPKLSKNGVTVWTVNNREINLIPAKHLSNYVADPDRNGAGFLQISPQEIAHIKSII